MRFASFRTLLLLFLFFYIIFIIFILFLYIYFDFVHQHDQRSNFKTNVKIEEIVEITYIVVHLDPYAAARKRHDLISLINHFIFVTQPL